ncbi:MAG: M56 family metallopeptidase, partial [Phycisphaerae bacterium]|nr:M56 family metallopeptidase [Gemmatimonadaceae bacterium]
MTSWILYSVSTATLIAIAALAAEGLLKSARRPIRGVWFAAIALTIAVTITAPWRADPTPTFAIRPTTLAQEIPEAALRELSATKKLSQFANGLTENLLMPLQRATDAAAAAPASLNNAARLLLVVSAAVALLVLLTVYARSMRERIKWPKMKLLGRNVRVTPNVGPAVLGLAPPEIVVPQWVLLRDVEEQRLVLEHESEHVRANDPMLLMLACVAVASMPWNPAVWFMWSRLRLAVELDCDRRVLMRGVQKPAYGQLLVELSSNRPWTSPAIPAFSWGTSHLEQRLVAMTARPKRFRTARRIASGVVVATALLAAASAELPEPQELQAMESSQLATSATGPVQRMAVDTQLARSTGLETRELARVATALRARAIQLRASEQDTIPRKKVRKAPVAVLKK